MNPPGDEFVLLRRYAEQRDEAAFAALVRRYLDLVYSAAARRVGERTLAEDVTQAVFLILAQKAKSIREGTVLSAWLLKTVRYCSANAMKIEARRRKHEAAAATNRAVGMASANPMDVLVWQEVAQRLDDAVLKLPATDRRAVLMRYFQNRPIAEIAADLNVTEGAAKQRLSRAAEKLRQKLDRSGVALPAVGGIDLGMLLATHAVRAAPAGLMRTACAAAISGTVAGGAGITIAKGAITMMKWTNAKIAAAIAAAALLTGTGTVLTINRGFAQDHTPAPIAAKSEAQSPELDKKANNGIVGVESAPPVIVSTLPQAGATDIDAAATTEIKITFSKDMEPGNLSWVRFGKDTFPKTTGKAHFLDDKRTCVLPVQLEAGHPYVIWLNKAPYDSFSDSSGNKAVPYLLVFETKK